MKFERDSASETILDYIAEISQHEDAIGADEELLQSGILDSLSIFTLINFVEDSFDFKFNPAEITIETVSTVSNMLDHIQSRMSG